MKERIINLIEEIFVFVKKRIKELMSQFKNVVIPFIRDNKKIVKFTIIGILLLIVMGILISVLNKEKVGNVNGNLNNLGFTVENKNAIYYLGYNKGSVDGIYKIKKGKKQKLIDDYVLYLNQSGNYIYYIDAINGDIVRIKNNGKDKKIIVEDVDLEKFTVMGSWIYYIDDAKLCRIRTNGKDKQVISEKLIENYEINGDWIYYSYKNNGKYIISKIKRNGEEITKINEDAGVVFFIKGNYVYYIYENNNHENDEKRYELYKVKTNGKNKKKILDLPKDIYIASINFSDNNIYYLKQLEESNLAICKMNLKKEEETKIVDIKGFVTYINIIDDWIYYPDVNDEGNDEMFRIKTNGENKETL